MATQKPLLVFGTLPIYGHTMPPRAIAKNLIQQGYEVIFMCGSHFKTEIESIGAKFAPYQGRADFSEVTGWAHVPPPPSDPRGPPLFDFIHKVCWGVVEREQKGREVVTLHDQSWYGTLPGLLGAPGLRAAGDVGIGIVPVVCTGKDVPPFGLALKPDPSGKSAEKFAAPTQDVYWTQYAPTQQEWVARLKELGVKDCKEDTHVLDLQYSLPNRFLQMCVPSIEWPRVDLPRNFQFAGGLPKGHRDPFPELPNWWGDIANGKKRIVAVSQGTLDIDDYNKVIIPTLEGLKDLPNVIVVAALGKKGAILPEDYSLLPLSDVFVTNGGYGGLNHALSHVMPMVISGVATDKPENAARMEWAGVAVNLDVEVPKPEALRAAVEKILGNPEYKKRAEAIQTKMDSYDPMGAIVQAIEEVAAEGRAKKTRT
ncbi:UDP-Glycosyltransferase/glycogen phosphorylase [Acephala macrosclerotiorum]|nr:UDP-Glycosyltransferase/glycogen phosphorylase [Acephala macrosclerotiorum]